MNQNDRDALCAAILIKAYCTNRGYCENCIFYEIDCKLAQDDPEDWKIKENRMVRRKREIPKEIFDRAGGSNQYIRDEDMAKVFSESEDKEC